MNKILLVHTTLKKAFVALADNGSVIDKIENDNQREHGSFLHPAIQLLLERNSTDISGIAALGVTNGPGSYTGIRVGLSAVKGLAFALKVPVILCSTLEVLAASAIQLKKYDATYIPMIHARQDEYYAGFYDYHCHPFEPDALIDISEIISGEGKSRKFYFGPDIEPDMITDVNWEFISVNEPAPDSFASIVYNKLIAEELTTAANAIPNYLKQAYTTKTVKKET